MTNDDVIKLTWGALKLLVNNIKAKSDLKINDTAPTSSDTYSSNKIEEELDAIKSFMIYYD